MAKEIYVHSGECIMHEYTSEGGQDAFVNSWNIENASGMYSSFESLLSHVSRMFGLPETKDYYVFMSGDGDLSTIQGSYLADKNGDIIDYDGGDAYIVDVVFIVSIVDERPMTDEDAKEFDIPLY